MAPDVILIVRLRNYLTRLELRAMADSLERGLADLERMPRHLQGDEFRRVHAGIVRVVADVNAVIERLRTESGKEI